MPIRPLFHDLFVFFAQTYRDVFGLLDGPPLHDPIAVAVLLDNMLDNTLPNTLAFDDREGERWSVKVVTDGQHSYLASEQGQVGRTVARKVMAGQGGVRIPRGTDVQRFWNIIDDCISRAEAVVVSYS